MMLNESRNDDTASAVSQSFCFSIELFKYCWNRTPTVIVASIINMAPKKIGLPFVPVIREP
jgi:hypothetical protein